MSVVKKEMFFNVKNRYLEQTVFLLWGLGRGELEKKSCTSRRLLTDASLIFSKSEIYQNIRGGYSSHTGGRYINLCRMCINSFCHKKYYMR